jgi:hypothetical protein
MLTLCRITGLTSAELNHNGWREKLSLFLPAKTLFLPDSIVNAVFLVARSVTLKGTGFRPAVALSPEGRLCSSALDNGPIAPQGLARGVRLTCV